MCDTWTTIETSTEHLSRARYSLLWALYIIAFSLDCNKYSHGGNAVTCPRVRLAIIFIRDQRYSEFLRLFIVCEHFFMKDSSFLSLGTLLLTKES